MTLTNALLIAIVAMLYLYRVDQVIVEVSEKAVLNRKNTAKILLAAFAWPAVWFFGVAVIVASLIKGDRSRHDFS